VRRQCAAMPPLRPPCDGRREWTETRARAADDDAVADVDVADEDADADDNEFEMHQTCCRGLNRCWMRPKPLHRLEGAVLRRHFRKGDPLS